MQDTPPNRSTFLALRDVLALGWRHAVQVRPYVIEPMSEAAADERTAMFLAVLLRQRLELERALAHCVSECPAPLLETRVQYIVSPWPREKGQAAPPVAHSMEELIERILELDEPIVTAFGDLAERASRSDARQLFGQLTDLLEAHHHRLVRQLNDAHDL